MVAQQEHRFNDQFREALERPVEMVKEYPLASMLLMFGMGLGVGVVVSQSLCSVLAEMTEERALEVIQLLRLFAPRHRTP